MTLLGYDTILPACSLEFCPAPGRENMFAVGTYKLEESSVDTESVSSPPASSGAGAQKRRGECLLLELVEDTEDCNLTLLVSSVDR